MQIKNSQFQIGIRTCNANTIFSGYMNTKTYNKQDMNKKEYDQHRAKRTQIRQDQVAAGFFDGRFVQRAEESKKAYSRKKKHKKDLDY